MNWLAFIASLADSLAWPGAILVAVVILRRPLIRLLPELRELRYKDLRVDFGRKLEEAEAQAAVAELPERLNQPDLPRNAYPKTFQEYVARIAETSPRAAIAEAWRFVEDALYDIAEKLDLPQPYSAPAIEHFLRRHGHVPEPTANLLQELRSLRNRAVHAGDFELTSEQAREYGELAVRLSSALYSSSKARDEAPPSTSVLTGSS